ncbi:hypothetical protein [Candidatus Alkanophaga liquidiphilum]
MNPVDASKRTKRDADFKSTHLKKEEEKMRGAGRAVIKVNSRGTSEGLSLDPKRLHFS